MPSPDTDPTTYGKRQFYRCKRQGGSLSECLEAFHKGVASVERSKAARALAGASPMGPQPASRQTERNRSRTQKPQASQDSRATQLPQASQASQALQAEPAAKSPAPSETIPAAAREVSDNMLLGCLNHQRCGNCLMCTSMI